jgi:hypothetical protein
VRSLARSLARRLEAVREQMVLFGEGGKAFLADPQKIVAAVRSVYAHVCSGPVQALRPS